MPANQLIDKKIVQNLDYPHKIDVRYIEQMSETKVTILVIDRKESLGMELSDDSKSSFDEAIGLSTYSNSKAGVLSYVAIFEKLWDQTKLCGQVKDTNEQLASVIKQLKVQDKVQREFINIAAHELRTPIQPKLGLSDLLFRPTQTEMKRRELLEVIVRNAKRLERLAEDILDVTKIETKSLVLKKESINLNEILVNAIADSKNQIIKEQKDKTISVQLQLINSKIIRIEADRSRINQVISNLLSDAIKATNEGNISIVTYKHKPNDVIISVIDTGIGLDPDILPRLFSKFATKASLLFKKTIDFQLTNELCL